MEEEDSDIDGDIFPELDMEESVSATQERNKELDAVVWWIVAFTSFHFLPSFSQCILYQQELPWVTLEKCQKIFFHQRGQRFLKELHYYTKYSKICCVGKNWSVTLAKMCSACLKALRTRKTKNNVLLKEIVSGQGSKKFYPNCIYLIDFYPRNFNKTAWVSSWM